MPKTKSKYTLRKVFERCQMPQNVKDALSKLRNFQNDCCISFHIQLITYDDPYREANNTVVKWLLEHGAKESDGMVLIDVTW